MSINTTLEHPCDDETGACDAIEIIITPRLKDIGSFSVRRAIPFVKRRMVGPWVFFDHAGPATFAPGEGIDVRPHPHINLATVSYLFDGEIMHKDSLGSEQRIIPGDINLMVAGKGIVHSERTPDDVRAKGHTLHLLQLWHALPEEQEEIDPAFYHYPARDLPTTMVGGVPVRVMIGSAYGVTSPVKTFAETLYFEADLDAGQTITLPNIEERAVYVAKGSVSARESVVEEYSLAVFNKGTNITLKANKASRIALIGGEKMAPRFMEWNFISSRKERLEQAKDDWRNQRFPTVPGDEDEFIPLPE